MRIYIFDLGRDYRAISGHLSDDLTACIEVVADSEDEAVARMQVFYDEYSGGGHFNDRTPLVVFPRHESVREVRFYFEHRDTPITKDMIGDCYEDEA